MRECEWCGDEAQVVAETSDGDMALCLDNYGCATDPEWARFPQREL